MYIFVLHKTSWWFENTEDGLFAQWVQGYEVGAEALQMIGHTMREVFGHVSLWQLKERDLLFIGSQQPLSIDMAKLNANVSLPPYRDFLGRVSSLHGAEGVLAMHLANDAFMEVFTAQAVPYRRHGAVSIVHLDGSTGSEGLGNLTDQRRWINAAHDGLGSPNEFSHTPD